MQSNSQNRRDRYDPKATAPREEPIVEEEVQTPAPVEEAEETVASQVEADPVEEDAEPVVEEAPPAYGVVTDCLRLNVRQEPKADAEVVTIIDALSEVMVDLDKSTEEFYKVCTASGIEGFCMKKFVALRR